MAAKYVILIIFLLVCLFTDLKYRKVYNWATFTVMALGLILNAGQLGFEGVKLSLFGLLGGFFFLIVFYGLGGMGAGDVKFLMAVGSMMGLWFMLKGALYGALMGGLAAGIVLAAQNRFVSTVKEIGARFALFLQSKVKTILIFDETKSVKLPYTAFLALGMLLALMVKQLARG